MAPIREAVGRVLEHDVRIKAVCKDADDDHVIACAVAARADYLVTGDADLLAVKKHQGVKIVTPRDFEALFV